MQNAIPCMVAAAMLFQATTLPADVTLTGHHATPEQIAAIADGERVQIAPEAMRQVEKAHKVLVKAAAEGQMIYGLTVGVGLNKDRKFVDAKGELTQEIIDASRAFQTGLIRAHSGSVGQDM
ncbi:MAG TPA: aromatic amino acid lyase, partial [Holophaga sp.]|nr:aromatic amino acid lyase [Holophaga sp.]